IPISDHTKKLIEDPPKNMSLNVNFLLEIKSINISRGRCSRLFAELIIISGFIIELLALLLKRFVFI
mgnify:CR=1